MFGLIPWRKREDTGSALRRADHPLARIRDEFGALFDHLFGGWPALGEWGREGWGVDSEETDKEYVFRVEAPGFEVEDFDVQVSGNVLTVRAERKQEAKANGGTFAQRRFQQAFTLPVGADAQKAEARYRNGVLELRLPKTADAQAKKITVQGA
jgi:HSP20 family protein